MTPCPTCQTLLRVPPGAAMIRCPKCKTVLEVEAPPAAAAPAPPPLPFGRPAAAPTSPVRATPVRGTPAAAKPAVPAGGPIRARLSPVQVEDTPEANAAERDRIRRMREELRKLEEREEDERERMEVLEEHCNYGRTGMHLLTWGTRANALAVLCYALCGIMYNVFEINLMWLAVASGGLTLVLVGAGFGYAVAGPVMARHIAIGGVVATVFQIVLCGLEMLGGMARFGRGEMSNDTWYGLLWFQEIAGVATNFPLLADHPARFVKGYSPYVSVIALLAATAEFARLALVCMLTQYYAAEGKDDRLADRSMATMNRVFWVVLLAAAFRLATAALLDGAPKEDTMALIGKSAHILLTIGLLTGVGVNLLFQSQAMAETAEIVDHRRFGDDSLRGH